MSKTLDRSERRKQRLEIVYRPIGEMKPDPANARQHSKQQVRKLANSIETFGFNVPVLVDAELNVIAGHGRLAACRALGVGEVPTLCLDHLSPAQLRAFMIADNRLTAIGRRIGSPLARAISVVISRAQDADEPVGRQQASSLRAVFDAVFSFTRIVCKGIGCGGTTAHDAALD
jgi:ParB-like chromosome segregation protein Spo0J